MYQPRRLYCKSKSIAGFFIRLVAVFRRLSSGKAIPKRIMNHVASLVYAPNGVWVVIESDMGRGVTCEALEDWKKRKRGQIVHESIPPRGFTPRQNLELFKSLHRFVGREYEPLHELALVAFNKNDNDADRIFCSELCMRGWPIGLNPDTGIENTEPDELVQHDRENGWGWHRFSLKPWRP